MKNYINRKRIVSAAAAVVLSVTVTAGALWDYSVRTFPEASLHVALAAESTVNVIKSSGYEEGGYVTWSPVSGASGYNVYADGKQIDSMLIRQYSGYFRADIIGISAGQKNITIVPIINGTPDTSKQGTASFTAIAHDRSGFAFVNGDANGAYQSNGTLKSNAVVLYITESTKDSVKMDVVTDSKGSKTTCTGVQNILTAYQKGSETRPLCLRFIGNITDPSVLMDGDLLLKGSGSTKRLSCGVTIEGIGDDTVFNGFGLRIANASNVEVRNIGFMNCNSGEGDDVGLQQNNDHIWVHNCDMFYGDAGSDADQVKGDGALDTKTSSYITHSYNHFWDNGKCNLQGMKSESTENYITYHHNWYDHSDSRHPRVRTCTVHCYNNYYDGNAKYGAGATMGCSIFMDSNYFRNCKYPMLISMQGSDTGTFSGENGGIIKAYGNYMTGQKSFITYQQNNTSFDAYLASSRNEKVPSNVKTKQGGTTYNNFDTSSIMYNFTPDAAEAVPAKVMAHAGRVDGGDFKWTFNNSVDDEKYEVNQPLKNALVAYKGSVIAIGSGFKADTGTTTTTQTTATDTTTTTQTTTSFVGPDVPSGGIAHNFTTNGKNSTFYSISGNLSTSKGTVNYNNMTLTQCLKMETATSIEFDAFAPGTLTLVFVEPAATVKVDGKKYTCSDGSGIITVPLAAGSHTITKADTANLFYMTLSIDEETQTSTTESTTAPPETTTTTTVTRVEPTTEITPITPGDANCDGNVTIADAVFIMQSLALPGKYQLSVEGQANADVAGNNDGVTNNDALAIQRYMLGLVKELPIQ